MVCRAACYKQYAHIATREHRAGESDRSGLPERRAGFWTSIGAGFGPSRTTAIRREASRLVFAVALMIYASSEHSSCER